LRGARYVAVAVVARPDGEARAFRGEVRGRLLTTPRGAGGFGYDPLFFYEPYGATFAEVSDERKHAVSHRGAAFARLVEWLASPEGERFTCGG
jgi:XTP/dITP diphosphohydrolase